MQRALFDETGDDVQNHEINHPNRRRQTQAEGQKGDRVAPQRAETVGGEPLPKVFDDPEKTLLIGLHDPMERLGERWLGAYPNRVGFEQTLNRWKRGPHKLNRSTHPPPSAKIILF